MISSDDPVRVYQRYATLDAVSAGRAEVILGRGSSTESFPLFGYDLNDYEELFEEKVALFAELLKEKPVTWSGNTRAALDGISVYPHSETGSIPTWIGVGGSPRSVIRTAQYGFSLMLAIIGGDIARFAPFSELYRRALAEFGHPARPIGVHAPGHVAATDEQAVEEFVPAFQELIRSVARQRGFRTPTRESLMQDVGPGGALHRRITWKPSPERSRTPSRPSTRPVSNLKYGITGMPHDTLMTNIELYGTKVAPLVRELMAD
ncbi:LLM class flavin-dependent oxidoreductase [Streptomyces sp. L7]